MANGLAFRAWKSLIINAKPEKPESVSQIPWRRPWLPVLLHRDQPRRCRNPDCIKRVFHAQAWLCDKLGATSSAMLRRSRPTRSTEGPMTMWRAPDYWISLAVDVRATAVNVRPMRQHHHPTAVTLPGSLH